MPQHIPVASADLSGNESAYVAEAIRSTWISSTGPFVERFEREFAVLCSSQSALSVCNGTSALHLLMAGLGLGGGDEVLVPSLTYIATANAVRYTGAEPVFVDVDPQTWCLDPDRLADACTQRTRGIIAVHLLGHPADMERILEFANRRGLWVVEDAAEALGARYKGRKVGSLGRAASFSFFGNKILTCGEGGAVTTSDEILASRLRLLRGQGMDPDRRYFFTETGYNYRLSNLACAVLCAQMERFTAILDTRRQITRCYAEMLADIPGVEQQPVAAWAELSPWMYPCRIDKQRFGVDRDKLIDELARHDIETRPMFIPLHTLPPFREASRRRRDALPVSEQLGQSVIMLPLFNTLGIDDLTRIVSVIRNLQEHGPSIRQA